MALDVAHLTGFVSQLENAFMLEQNLDELQQTVALMQSENHEEFYDISIRNKKYGRVDAMNGPVLLEKYVAFLLCYPAMPKFVYAELGKGKANVGGDRITTTVENTSRTAPLANFGSRFGLR